MAQAVSPTWRDHWYRRSPVGRARASIHWLVRPTPHGSSMHPLFLTLALLLGSAVVIYLACEYLRERRRMGRPHAWRSASRRPAPSWRRSARRCRRASSPSWPWSSARPPRRRRSASAPRWAGRWCWRRSPTPSSGDAPALPRAAAANRGDRASSGASAATRPGSWSSSWSRSRSASSRSPASPGWASLFLAAYGAYFWREMRSEAVDDEGGARAAEARARKATAADLGRRAADRRGAGRHLRRVAACSCTSSTRLAPALGLPPQLLALLLSPIATELPEILNAVIWVRQGKIGWRWPTSAAR